MRYIGKSLKVNDVPFTILSNNCIAGFLYHDFGLKFESPTINLQIAPDDFIKLLKNLDYYRSYDLVEDKDPDIGLFQKLGGDIINFPVGKLGDITIFFQHYKSFDVAKNKWIERFKRLDMENLHVILVDTYCDNAVLEEFSKLNAHKLFLTADKRKLSVFDKQSCYLMSDIKEGESWYSVINEDIFLRRHYMKFDFIKWFNQS